MKTKKFASLFLATTLLTGILAGCSGGDDESTSSEGGDTIKIGA